jgi:hypothetical protein
VLYAPDLKQEVLSMQKIFMHYALKFVKLVQKNVLNMLLITQAAKHVLKLVKNVLKFALNLQVLLHNFISILKGNTIPLKIDF